jgi:hypothetical protein
MHDIKPKTLPEIDYGDFNFDNPIAEMGNNVTKLFAMCLALRDTLDPDQFRTYSAAYDRYLSSLHLKLASTDQGEES